ncbi:hypothetical protein PRUPE_7G182000 [Prunus persica]|uniref:PGG domain-containing protein n=1 Tax=Prunus persica TaxID=3760 RepID=A0A251ND75_PRUPE|nr:uncharacterized protein LOC18770062 [Prunus persica]ONH97295.1 hypothetical protein PRUPE_7G182000 [Prunus persica]
MKMEAWNLAEAKLQADRRNHEAGMDLDVHNAADEVNVDALWQHREHVDQVLTPTKDTVLSHCPGCCEQLLVYNKENLNALHIVIADDDSLLPTLKERSSAKAEMEEVEEKKGGSSCRGFSVFKCGKDADVILKEVKEAHLVMATLIATVTFVAGFAMADYESEKGGGQASPARNAALIVFVVTDTLALCMSACSVLMHFYLPGPNAIVLSLSSTMSALIFMAIAFISGAYAASGHSPGLAVAASVLGCWYFWAAFFMLGRPSAKAFLRHFNHAATAA